MLLGDLEHCELEHEGLVASKAMVNVLLGHIACITLICLAKLVDRTLYVGLITGKLTEKGCEAIEKEA